MWPYFLSFGVDIEISLATGANLLAHLRHSLAELGDVGPVVRQRFGCAVGIEDYRSVPHLGLCLFHDAGARVEARPDAGVARHLLILIGEEQPAVDSPEAVISCVARQRGVGAHQIEDALADRRQIVEILESVDEFSLRGEVGGRYAALFLLCRSGILGVLGGLGGLGALGALGGLGSGLLVGLFLIVLGGVFDLLKSFVYLLQSLRQFFQKLRVCAWR